MPDVAFEQKIQIRSRAFVGAILLLLCLATSLTLVCVGCPIISLLIHQPAFPSIWPATPSLQWCLSANLWVTVWYVCGCSWRDGVCGCCRGGLVVMDVIWRRLCVSMIGGREIWVWQGCDECGDEVSLQSCQCVMEVCAVFCYCLLWLDA